MGRPSKLNEELIKNMAEEIADGTPIEYTCDYFSVTRVSYYNWMEIGEKDFEAGIDSLHAEFFNSIKKAAAKHIIDCKRRIKAGEPGWQGTAWWLERTNVKFMPKQQIQADEDGKVTVVIGGKQKQNKQ